MEDNRLWLYWMVFIAVDLIFAFVRWRDQAVEDSQLTLLNQGFAVDDDNEEIELTAAINAYIEHRIKENEK